MPNHAWCRDSCYAPSLALKARCLAPSRCLLRTISAFGLLNREGIWLRLRYSMHCWGVHIGSLPCAG